MITEKYLASLPQTDYYLRVKSFSKKDGDIGSGLGGRTELFYSRWDADRLSGAESYWSDSDSYLVFSNKETAERINERANKIKKEGRIPYLLIERSKGKSTSVPLKARRTTPKYNPAKKYGVRILENSVRRMV